MDEELLPEVRLQLEKCDEHMFFTDEGSPVAPAHDIARVKVPPQALARTNESWLDHRNMAAVTPVWSYLLGAGIPEKFDWALHVELDHFTRPVQVRRAIRETLQTLQEGSEWEKTFSQRPMMLAFGNAFVFNRPMVKEMKKQWPLPGMTEENGCPSWSTPECAQDMVYPRMMSRFVPPIQVFGPTGCGKVQRSEAEGGTFPFTCWEFYQNPLGEGRSRQSEDSQLRALPRIAAGGGRRPGVRPDKPPPHIARSLVNLTADEAEAYWPGRAPRKMLEAEVKWETYFPPKDIPIIHHVLTAAVAKEARRLLGA